MTLSQGLREEVERLSRELHKWESYNIDQLVSIHQLVTIELLHDVINYNFLLITSKFGLIDSLVIISRYLVP